MRILVVGDGKVGHAIAGQLTKEEHDVVVVDKNDAVLQRTQDELDVLCVRGNGANAKTLMDAGADRADIVIATMDNDEANMLCCLLSRHLGAKYTIARVRDPDYNESLTMLQHELGIDLAVNPERATALEISRLLRFPFANTIEPFAKGRVEMVEFRAQENDRVVGIPLIDLTKKLHNVPQVLYAAVERGGEVIIPKGDFVIHADDRVHVVADLATITAYFRYLGRDSLRIKDVMILGGGRISYYLAKIISSVSMRVSMIEINEKKALSLSETLPGVNVIQGDGTDQELLEQEGLRDMDAFIALCDRDEENLMAGLHAVQQGVPKVVVKNSHDAYANLIGGLGLDSIVTPKLITCANILRYVRARVNGQDARVERLYRMMNGRLEALEFIARENDPCIGIPLRDLQVRPSTLIAVIVRHGKVIVPFGNDHIEANDSVIVTTRESGISDLNEVIHK